MPYADPELRRAYARAWIRRNPEKAREAMRRWRLRHPDLHSAEVRAYYARYREKWNQRMAAYHRANPDVRRTASERRRGRLFAAQGSYTTREWLALVLRYDGRCAYCGAEGPLEVDHRTPLSRGGTNGIDNILPACRVCNRHKHSKTEAEFRARLSGQ